MKLFLSYLFQQRYGDIQVFPNTKFFKQNKLRASTRFSYASIGSPLLLGVVCEYIQMYSYWFRPWLFTWSDYQKQYEEGDIDDDYVTRTFSQQLPVGLWQMIWAPRYLMIPLQVPVEAYDFNQVSIFIRYIWVLFDTSLIVLSDTLIMGLLMLQAQGYFGQLVRGPDRLGIRAILTVGNPSQHGCQLENKICW